MEVKTEVRVIHYPKVIKGGAFMENMEMMTASLK